MVDKAADDSTTFNEESSAHLVQADQLEVEVLGLEGGTPVAGSKEDWLLREITQLVARSRSKEELLRVDLAQLAVRSNSGKSDKGDKDDSSARLVRARRRRVEKC